MINCAHKYAVTDCRRIGPKIEVDAKCDKCGDAITLEDCKVISWPKPAITEGIKVTDCEITELKA